MSRLLLDENPLIVQPELAVKIGLNEAIFLQQLHYWLQKSKNVIDGLKWSYNTYEELHEQFPFFSISTIKRIVKNLSEKGILLVGKFSKDSRDKTNWYSIDYSVFEALFNDEQSVDDAECQSDTMESVNLTQSDSVNLTRCNKVKSLTETSTETSTERKNINTKVSSQAQEIIDHLNNTLGTNYKATSAKTKALIQARLNEGFTVDDFKRVHIIKFSEWTGTDMEKYLRPETLYSNKFEGYLNQKTSDYEKLKAINAHTGLSALDLLRQQGMAS